MTVAAIFISKTAPFEIWAFSDVLLSNGIEKMTEGAHSPFVRESHGKLTLGSDLVQKAQIIGPLGLWWAGRYIEACALVRELKQIQHQKFNEVKRHVDRFIQDHTKNLDFVLIDTREDIEVFARGPSVYSEQSDTVCMITVGSGSGDVVWEEFGKQQVSYSKRNEVERPTYNHFLMKLGEYYYREFQGRIDYKKAYGYGAEIVRWSKPEGLRKVSSSVTWLVPGNGMLSEASRVYTAYKNNIMYLVSLFPDGRLAGGSLSEPVFNYKQGGAIVRDMKMSPKKLANDQMSELKQWMLQPELEYGLVTNGDNSGELLSFRQMPPRMLQVFLRQGQQIVKVAEEWPDFSKEWFTRVFHR